MFNIRWSKLQQVLASRLPESCIHLDCSLASVEAKPSGGVTATFERSDASAAKALGVAVPPPPAANEPAKLGACLRDADVLII